MRRGGDRLKERDDQITGQMAIGYGEAAKKLIAAGSKRHFLGNSVARKRRRHIGAAIDGPQLVAEKAPVVVYRQGFDISLRQYQRLCERVKDVDGVIG